MKRSRQSISRPAKFRQFADLVYFSGCRANPFLIPPGVTAAIALTLLAAVSANQALAQVPVMALPTTYTTYNNKTGAYQNTNPLVYNSFTDAYANAKVVQGVPNSIFSFVVTSGEAAGNGYNFIRSTVGLPAVPAPPAPARPFNLTIPAGRTNNSLGGLMDSFGWGVINTEMNQCFAGGFAFNMQGSLQGARPAGGGAVVAAPRVIPYTFASGANFNELSYGILQPNGNSGPAVATAGADFTQGWAFGSTNTAGAGNPSNTFSVYNSFNLGRSRDPFVAGSPPYGIGNQVPTLGGAANLQAGGFESPVYASVDAPLGAGGVDPAAANNARKIDADAANSWAILLGMTPDRPEFSLDIQREYAALLSNGVPRNHIAVLYGDGSSASLARFTNLNAGNNMPNVNSILNTVGANFQVPVQGATTIANIQGLLNPAIVQNPAAPLPARKNYWESLFGVAPGTLGPVAGNNLLFYTTGHGSAVNVFGGDVTASNRNDGPGIFTTDIKLTAPDNVEISPGKNVTAQITTRSPIINPLTDTFKVNGVPIGGATIGTLGVDAFDVSTAADENAIGPYFYYNVSIPSQYLTTGPGYDGNFTFSISTLSLLDSNQLDSITLMDDVPSVGALGLADMYVDLIGREVPEPAAFVLVAASVLSRLWSRQRRLI